MHLYVFLPPRILKARTLALGETASDDANADDIKEPLLTRDQQRKLRQSQARKATKENPKQKEGEETKEKGKGGKGQGRGRGRKRPKAVVEDLVKWRTKKICLTNLLSHQ